MSAVDDVLATLAALVAKEVVRELRAGPSDLISQAASPLGKRRHCSAVRARMARGDGSACIVGRAHFLTAAALREELVACKAPKRRAPARAAVIASTQRDELAELRAELGIIIQQKGAA